MHVCMCVRACRCTCLQRPTLDKDCTFRKCRLATYLNSERVDPFVEVTDGMANITVVSRDIEKECKCKANFTKCYSENLVDAMDLNHVSIVAKVHFTGWRLSACAHAAPLAPDCLQLQPYRRAPRCCC